MTCGSIQSKIWGTTQCIYTDAYCEVHYLQINVGGYCSKHKHEKKWNRFFVIKGKLKITVYQDHCEDVTILTSDMFTDIPDNVYHRFEALEDTLCNEIYWVDKINSNDIVREDHGGNCNSNTSTS